MLNISFIACTKVQLWDLKICIAVNREKFQSRAICRFFLLWNLQNFLYLSTMPRNKYLLRTLSPYYCTANPLSVSKKQYSCISV